MGHKKVPLSQIKTLTLHADRMTTSRRVKPVPQLRNLGKRTRHSPQVVQCTQTGHDGVSAQWRCEADLPQGLRFGEIEVTCEGWSKPGDQNVLAGSCGLEYTLTGQPTMSTTSVGGSGFDAGALFTRVLWFAVLAYFAWGIWRAWRGSGAARAAPRGPGGPGGSGGGGGGPGGWFPGFGGGPGGGGAPPPYSPSPPPYKPSSSSSGAGFWTGLAAGAAGTALLNRATRDRGEGTRYAAPPTPSPRAGGRWDRPSGVYEAQDEAGPSRRSTGFGGTRTR